MSSATITRSSTGWRATQSYCSAEPSNPMDRAFSGTQPAESRIHRVGYACLRTASGRGGTGGRAGLVPAAGDRQAAVAAEVLRGDLRSRRVLPPLVLGPVDHLDHPADKIGIMTGGDQAGGAHGGIGGVSPRTSACSLRHRARSQTSVLSTSLIGAKPPAESP